VVQPNVEFTFRMLSQTRMD